MLYWKIRIDSEEDADGWLVLDEYLNAQRLTYDDGTDILHPIDYTTVDTEATPPEWA